jgi:hypothetical protein
LVGTQSKENAMGLREGDKIRVVGTVRTEFVGSDRKPTLEIEVDGHYIFARRDLVELIESKVGVGDTVESRYMGDGHRWTVLAVDGRQLWCKPIGENVLPPGPVNMSIEDVWRVDPEPEAGQ